MGKACKCARKEVAQLEKDMKPFSVDPSLVQSMHLCLTKNHEELSEFDKTMLGNLDAGLNECMEDLSKQLAAEQPAMDARAAELEKCKSAQVSAKEKMEESKVAFSEAKSVVSKAKALLKEAEGKVASYDADMAALEA